MAFGILDPLTGRVRQTGNLAQQLAAQPASPMNLPPTPEIFNPAAPAPVTNPQPVTLGQQGQQGPFVDPTTGMAINPKTNMFEGFSFPDAADTPGLAPSNFGIGADIPDALTSGGGNIDPANFQAGWTPSAAELGLFALGGLTPQGPLAQVVELGGRGIYDALTGKNTSANFRGGGMAQLLANVLPGDRAAAMANLGMAGTYSNPNAVPDFLAPAKAPPPVTGANTGVPGWYV